MVVRRGESHAVAPTHGMTKMLNVPYGIPFSICAKRITIGGTIVTWRSTIWVINLAAASHASYAAGAGCRGSSRLHLEIVSCHAHQYESCSRKQTRYGATPNGARMRRN
jgi:hypothetical protein